MLKNILFLIIAVILFIPAIIQAQIQWDTDGTFIASATAIQVNICAVPDGNGGAFMTYEDNPQSDTDIYAQWIDGSGNIRWGSTGVEVSTTGGNQKNPVVVSDGFGGIFVAWQDDVSGDIYAQHIGADGLPLWTSGSIAICSATEEQSDVKIVSDRQGGAILVWKDKRNESTSASDLYAQRINESGNFLWTTNGVPVTTASGNQFFHTIIGDHAGGVFVAWQDYRYNIDIYAQRINASGAQEWTTNGVAVVSDTKNQYFPTIDTSGNKLIVSWYDYRSGNSDVYAQALDFDGNQLWTTNGVPISTENGDQRNSRIARDNEGGAIITWDDNRTEYDIYAQRIDASGNVLWTVNGIAVNQSTKYQYSPEIVSDGSGGAIIVWNDNPTGTDINLYTQHIKGDGSLFWPEEGLPIVSVGGHQYFHVVISDESGGAVTFWQDGRSSKSDIYAQLTNDNLSFTAPSSGILWAGNQLQEIKWTLRTSQTRFDHFTLLASAIPGDGYPHIIDQHVSPTQYSQTWTPNAINSSTVRIKIQAKDAQDTVLCEYESEEFTIDSEPPDNFDLLFPADSDFVDLNPNFEWEATTDSLSGIDHFELWIGETLVQDDLQTTSYTLTEIQKLTPGSYTWIVKAVDGAGLVREALNTRSFTVTEDKTPPSPFHLVSPDHNTWTAQTTPPFTWESTIDTETGLRKYQLCVNDQLKIDNINPLTTSTNSLALDPGIYSWHIVAVDSAQNTTASSETWTIKIDNVPPEDFSLNQPGDNQWLQDTTPTFTWQATSDTGIGLAQYQLWIDDNLVEDNISASLSSTTIPEDKALQEGIHTWYIVAKDTLGNSCSSQTTFSVGVDITPPNNYTLISPEQGSFVTEDSPNFTWQSTTDDGSDLKEYELWIDEMLNVDGLSTTMSPPRVPLSEGVHTWSVRAIDNAVNITATSTFNFVADWTPPETFALISPSHDQTLHINQPTFTWRSTTDLVSGFDKFQFFLDGEKTFDNLSAQDTSVTLTEPLENGVHSWKVWVLDKAGICRVSDDYSFTVDCNPPQITSSNTTSATEDIPFTYTATATDPDGDIPDIYFQNYPFWLNPSEDQINGIPKEGAQDTSFLVVATDGIYSVSLKVTLNVQAVNDRPNITSSSTAKATEDMTFLYCASATDPDGDDLTFIFQQHPAWLTSSGNQISGKPIEGTQDTSFLVIVTDGSLSDTLKVMVTVSAVNDPPQITSSESAEATEDVLFTYTTIATDPDQDDLNFIFHKYPTWLTPYGSQISGKPIEGTQDTSFSVIATDGSLGDTLKVMVTVNAVNDPPKITSPDFAEATEDELFTYTASAEDPEGDDLTFTFQQYPTWLSQSGDQISGTPTEGIQNASFLVIVTDGSLKDTLEVTITVTGVNDPPEITSPDSVEATEDELFTYTASAEDPENDDLTFILEQHPTWLTQSGNQIIGTPTEGIQNDSFLVIVTDGSLTDTLKVIVTVTSVNDPPEITSPDSVKATEDELFTYTASAEDPEEDDLTFNFGQHPTWLTPSGNQISGTPTEEIQDTSFLVIVTDGSLSSTLKVIVAVVGVNDPPEITSPDFAEATEDELFTYTASAEDPEEDDITFNFVQHPTWLTQSEDQISGTPTNGKQDTSFIVIASDGFLTDTLVVQLNITPVNDPPEITSSDSVTAIEDTTFSYKATATDPEDDDVTFTYQNFPSWLTASDDVISGTAVEGTQDTSFVLIASDGLLTDTLNVSVNIQAVNDPPEVSSSDTAVATEKKLFRYRASAFDEDSPFLTIQFIDFASWLSSSGPEISGTPPNRSQDTTFKVIASDGFLYDTLVVTLIVIQVNDPPFFDYPFPQPVFSDIDTLVWELDLDNYVTDPDDPDSVLSWSYTLLDTNTISVLIDEKTHVTRIFGPKNAGLFRIAVTVTDPQGASATDTIKVSITETGIKSHKIADAPTDFILYDNYPNPFNPHTKIRYGIPRPCHVHLRVYNMLGQEVVTLVDKKQSQGTYELFWDASSMPSGLYFYQIQAGKWRDIKRMVLLK